MTRKEFQEELDKYPEDMEVLTTEGPTYAEPYIGVYDMEESSIKGFYLISYPGSKKLVERRLVIY